MARKAEAYLLTRVMDSHKRELLKWQAHHWERCRRGDNKKLTAAYDHTAMQKKKGRGIQGRVDDACESPVAAC